MEIQITLTKDEYNAMKPNEINNAFANEISEVIENRDALGPNCTDFITALKEIVNKYKRTLRTEQV